MVRRDLSGLDHLHAFFPGLAIGRICAGAPPAAIPAPIAEPDSLPVSDSLRFDLDRTIRAVALAIDSRFLLEASRERQSVSAGIGPTDR